MHGETIPKRICVLITHSALGGAQHAARRIARLLAEGGHDTRVWYMYDMPDSTARQQDHIVWPVRPRSVFEYWGMLGKLKRELRSDNFDAVISLLPLANTIGQGVALLAGVKRRIASQRTDPSTYSAPMRLTDRLAGMLGVYQTNVCVSNAVAASVRDYPSSYRRRIKIVHNAIEADTSDEALSRDQARQLLQLPSSATIAIGVGRLAAQKNFGLAVHAMPFAAEVTLVLAGDGPDRTLLQKTASDLGCADRVMFLGECDRVRLARLYRAADLFVQPTLFEGQSNALLEALNAGLPIISSDIPPQVETLLDAETADAAGIILPLDDPRVWGEAMARVASDPALAASLSQKARARALMYSPDVMRAGFEACINGD